MSQSTGVPAVDVLVIWSVAAAAIAGLGTLLWRVLRAVLRIADRLDAAWEDWTGSEARPGVPGRHGVMRRLSDHDEQLSDHDRRITRVEQLPNGNSP
ncbi:hypothetical protein [Streptomyces sp. NPDC020951]|uniref:hypothetical protein n=1 Tax=Streptomyces sp. NPDC020951 TaxID=3365104 RepID=UPI0037B12333